MAYIAGVVEDYRKRDFKAIEAKRLPLCSGNVSPDAVTSPGVMDFARKAAEAVAKYDDYTVTAVAAEKFRFVAGTKMVLVDVGGDEPIVTAGHAKGYQAPDGVAVRSLSQSEMRFVKKDGRWSWLGN
jgi:hypothetical protein